MSWICPHCGRVEDGTGPCSHTRPPCSRCKGTGSKQLQVWPTLFTRCDVCKGKGTVEK